MDEQKRGFVIMPFKEPYNSCYRAVIRPALEESGYLVSRADDLFSPRPIVEDIQRAIVEADLVLCEMSERNGNVFYELGLAHAIGKPAILLVRDLDDVPFDLRHIRLIVYETSLAGWEAKLREQIVAMAQNVDGDVQPWPPPLLGCTDAAAPVRGLAHEIDYNLQEIDRFLAQEYRVEGKKICAGGKSNVTFRYVSCMTCVFESPEVHSGLSHVDETTRSDVLNVYAGFREINDRVDALKQAFRWWRAEQYIEAINSFQENLRATANRLQTQLVRGRWSA